MEKNSKIYVAGHRGLVGSAIIRNLKQEGFNNLIVRTHSELDLINQKSVNEFFKQEKPNYVFLCAATVGGIVANDTYKADFIYDNLLISANVINASYKYGVEKLMNMGSGCIYPKFAKQPIKEEYLLSDKLEPTNEPYAIAKIAALKLCRYFNEQYGTDFLSVMPANLYGINDNFHLTNSHVLPGLLRKFHLAKLLRKRLYKEIINDLNYWSNSENYSNFSNDEIDNYLLKNNITKEYVKVWGSGTPKREFLYIDDLSEAVIFILNNFKYKDIGESMNIGSNVETQISDLAVLLKELIGFDGDISYDKSKPDGTPRKLLDSTKINKLGWESKMSLVDGINKTYNWYKNLF